ncbi:S26 family signal peptidase [Burkholderia vietnamiensis]|uniref:S26 family signal peptidase n=1 Tax=Burkholderia vietnamiensis TaxID=60552 RepID=UPI000A9212A7|nr:S26 family signal peptidase [Burkholderia vietnamiensis]MBR8189171.1 S26 family signal peptidase [Burkholderia vietnamiensis]HDR9174378.1 S26 family signal peptidase [Burkholderia vietnamiensis]
MLGRLIVSAVRTCIPRKPAEQSWRSTLAERRLAAGRYRPWVVAFTVLGCSAALFSGMYSIGWNNSPSLPGTVHLVSRWDKTPRYDERIEFTWRGKRFLPRGVDHVSFVKEVAGLPGDTIIVVNDSPCDLVDYYCRAEHTKAVKVFVKRADGKVVAIGVAKPYTRKSQTLETVHAGTVPTGYVFVRGTHPDSLDSRYIDGGLVKLSDIQGVAKWWF